MLPIQRRIQALLAVAALGAAGMFLRGEGWSGINFGPVGAGLPYAALWTHLGMLIVGWIVVSSMLLRQNGGGVELDQRDLRIAHRASHCQSIPAGGCAR